MIWMLSRVHRWRMQSTLSVTKAYGSCTWKLMEWKTEGEEPYNDPSPLAAHPGMLGLSSRQDAHEVWMISARRPKLVNE